MLSAKVLNSSFAEAHRVLLSEPTHMEDTGEDQENEEEDERDFQECNVESRRESRRTTTWNMDDTMRTTPWAMSHVRHCHECGETRENATCEGVLFTVPVGCSRLLSAVNDLTTKKSKILSKFHSEYLDEWASKTGLPVLSCCSFHELRGNWLSLIMRFNSVHSTATMRYWKKKTSATSGTDEKGLVLVVLLQIFGGDSSWLWVLFGSLIGVSPGLSVPICWVWDTNVFDISHIPHRMGNWSGFPVLICPSQCSSPQSSQFLSC